MIESFEDFLDDRNARKKCEQPIGFLFQLLRVGRVKAFTNAFREVQHLTALYPRPASLW
jgi:hypothetical protein